MVQDRWRQSPGSFTTEAVNASLAQGWCMRVREGAVVDNDLTV